MDDYWPTGGGGGQAFAAWAEGPKILHFEDTHPFPPILGPPGKRKIFHVSDVYVRSRRPWTEGGGPGGYEQSWTSEGEGGGGKKVSFGRTPLMDDL